jgi:NADH-quinone oxidoreductase subunit J
MELVIFALFALVALGAALLVVLHPDPVKSTLSLVVTLFATGVLFVLLGAPFIGTLQVLVYTGAIVVLFLFVVMLLNLQRESRTARSAGPQTIFALLGAVAFAAVAAVALWRDSGDAVTPPLTETFVDVREFAAELFARYLLTFEIVGVLLLVAVIAAYIIAKRPEPADSNLASPTTSGEDPR